MKFQQKVNECFGIYSTATIRAYSTWPQRLVEYHHTKTGQWIEPEQMTQWQVDEYLAQLVRGGDIEYSTATVNQAARAIKICFDYIGNPIEVVTVSTGHNYAPIVTLSTNEVTRLISKIPDFYLPAIALIYNDLVDTATACRFVINPYRGVPVTAQTINKQIDKAAAECDIVKSVSIRILRQSGIVHQLRATNDPAGVAERCGLKKDGVSFQRYMRAAGMLGAVGGDK